MRLFATATTCVARAAGVLTLTLLLGGGAQAQTPTNYVIWNVTNVMANVVDVAVGDPVMLTAEVDSFPEGAWVLWSNATPIGNGLQAIAAFSTGGEYTVTATGGILLNELRPTNTPPEGGSSTPPPQPGSASITIRAYEVTAVTANPNPVAVGDPLTATATVIPGPPPASVPITWSHGSGSGITTAIASLPVGWHNVTATCGTSQRFARVASVAVASILYQSPDGGWDELMSPSYFPLGVQVPLFATKDPVDAEWPASKPVWSGLAGGFGPSSAASMSPLAANPTDFRSISATCGNTISKDVLVYSFDIELAPEDNFPDRSTNEFGIAETVLLSVQMKPQGLAPAATGSYEFRLLSGEAVLSPPSGSLNPTFLGRFHLKRSKWC